MQLWHNDTNTIKIYGISKGTLEQSRIFTQFNVDNQFCIDSCCSDIKRIVNASAEVNVEGYKLIKTPIGTSLEGQNVTGINAFVSLCIKYNIIYSIDETEECFYSTSFQKRVCELIALPREFTTSTPIKITPYVEDINIKLENYRCIDTNIFVLLDVNRYKPLDNINSCINNSVCASDFNYVQNYPSSVRYFKEMVIEDILNYPTCNEDVGELVFISGQVKITSIKSISTEQLISLEGQRITGVKLIAEFIPSYLLTYKSKENCQNVYELKYETGLRSAFIVVPPEIEGIPIETLLQEDRIEVIPYVEEVCAVRICDDVIQTCMALFLNVDIK